MECGEWHIPHKDHYCGWRFYHYCDVIMGGIASQITSLTIVYSTLYSDADQRKHQSSASLAFVRGIHRGPVNSPHKWPVTRKMFPFDDVIMRCSHGKTHSHAVGQALVVCSTRYLKPVCSWPLEELSYCIVWPLVNVSWLFSTRQRQHPQHGWWSANIVFFFIESSIPGTFSV